MIDRFENLTAGVTRIYKSIQKIKRHRMDSLGLKGTHVMCLHYLSEYPDGLTAADLCGKCHEDKGGISRILSDLEKDGMGFHLFGFFTNLPSSHRESDPYMPTHGSIFCKFRTFLNTHVDGHRFCNDCTPV